MAFRESTRPFRWVSEGTLGGMAGKVSDFSRVVRWESTERSWVLEASSLDLEERLECRLGRCDLVEATGSMEGLQVRWASEALEGITFLKVRCGVLEFLD